jgi:hypothetical protein
MTISATLFLKGISYAILLPPDAYPKAVLLSEIAFFFHPPKDTYKELTLFFLPDMFTSTYHFSTHIYSMDTMVFGMSLFSHLS